MASYNKVVLLGNVTRTPDVRNLPGSATVVATTGIATNRKYKDKEEAPTIHNKKNYQDVYRLNLGTEYMLTPNWALRAGYVYDKSPINKNAMDTLVPVDNRHIASVGVGYQTHTWSLDFAYAHVFAEDLKGHSINTAAGVLPMEYSDGNSNMFSLTFGYKF